MVRRRQLKRSPLTEAMTRKRSSDFFFKKKIGLHESVAAPGDTNPSDATLNAALMSVECSVNLITYHHSRMWHGNAFGRVCLSVCGCVFVTFESFTFDQRVHLLNIYVKLVYQGHLVKVKVKVTGAKKRVCVSCSRMLFINWKTIRRRLL